MKLLSISQRLGWFPHIKMTVTSLCCVPGAGIQKKTAHHWQSKETLHKTESKVVNIDLNNSGTRIGHEYRLSKYWVSSIKREGPRLCRVPKLVIQLKFKSYGHMRHLAEQHKVDSESLLEEPSLTLVWQKALQAEGLLLMQLILLLNATS